MDRQATGFQVDSGRLVTGGILIALGGMIGLAGVALGTSAMVSAARRWARDSEVPPAEMLLQKLGQARTAAAAGYDAWQHTTDREPVGVS